MRAPVRFYYRWQNLAPCAIALALAACGSVPKSGAPAAQPDKPRQAAPYLPPAKSGRGAYYQDDGPGDTPPEGLLDTPDAEPKIEPHIARANRPYVVFGKTYTPITDNRPLKERGIGSWYGRKFHGQKTSSGELYDMYKMTAAHPTLPIPSYARVTHLGNGRQVTVRVNDRGPFLADRIIDLSYTAALKLGYLGRGSGELEVELLMPDEIQRIAKSKADGSAAPVPLVQAERSPTVRGPAESGPMPADMAERTAIMALFAQEETGSAAAPTEAGTGAYIQFGVFAQASNAEAARAELLRNGSAGLPPLQVVQTGSLYRIYSGPFATRAEAAGAAQRWSESGGIKPLVVER